MLRKTTFIILIVWLFSAESEANPGSLWYGELYPRLLFEGNPISRQYSGDHLKLYWGTGRPDPHIYHDYFSAKFWHDLSHAHPTRYQLVVRGDDGYRIFVNGELILDQISGVPLERIETEIELPAGTSRIYIEYYEMIGNASLDVQLYFIAELPQPRPTPTCDLAWFMTSVTPEFCPLDPPRTEQSTFQWFEGGAMMTLDGGVLIFHDADPFPRVTKFSFGGNSPPPLEPLNPPTGLYAPHPDLQLAWERSEGVRESLGWAIDPAVHYQAKHQLGDASTTVNEFDLREFVLLPTGEVREIQYTDFGRWQTVGQEPAPPSIPSDPPPPSDSMFTITQNGLPIDYIQPGIPVDLTWAVSGSGDLQVATWYDAFPQPREIILLQGRAGTRSLPVWNGIYRVRFEFGGDNIPAGTQTSFSYCVNEWFWSAEIEGNNCAAELDERLWEFQEYSNGYLLTEVGTNGVQWWLKSNEQENGIIAAATFADALAAHPTIAAMVGEPLTPISRYDGYIQCDFPGREQEAPFNANGCYIQLTEGRMAYRYNITGETVYEVLPTPNGVTPANVQIVTQRR